MKTNRILALVGVAIVLFSFGCTPAATTPPARPPQPPKPGRQRQVLLVGNSIAGTVSVIDAGTFTNIGAINIMPDLEQRLKEIHSPFAFWRGIIYRKIKEAQLITHGERSNGDRFVDDVFLSPDGTRMYVSRSNLGDVAAFDLSKPGFPLIWHTTVSGRKADHATISRDGSRIVVSASVVARAQVLETEHGRVIGSFRTGVLPHQNDYSDDGRHIYNGSLGKLDKPFKENDRKGRRILTVVDAETFKPVRTYPFDFGIRPTVITEDEKIAYMQLSYLNGVIKFDLESGKTLETVRLPLSDIATATYKNEDEFPHNSAHHGLALSKPHGLLCDCGTVDDNVAFVSTADMKVVATIERIGSIPYWATTSWDGNHCFVSLSGEDAIAVIDYRTRAVVTKVPVGKFPQRNRTGMMSEDAIALLASQKP